MVTTPNPQQQKPKPPKKPRQVKQKTELEKPGRMRHRHTRLVESVRSEPMRSELMRSELMRSEQKETKNIELLYNVYG